MGHAWTHPDPGDPHEHPVVAVIAIIAIIVAMLLIAAVRLAVNGTDELETALTGPPAQGELPAKPKPDAKRDERREVDAAVTSSRFATGFSP